MSSQRRRDRIGCNQVVVRAGKGEKDRLTVLPAFEVWVAIKATEIAVAPG